MGNAVVYSLTTSDLQLTLEISPGPTPYTGAQLVFEAQRMGGTTWFPLGGVEQDNLSVVTGTSANPLAIAPDGQDLAFKFDVSGCTAFRVWAAALTGGTINVGGNTGSFFASPPSGAALQYSLQLAMLWQLQHLTLLVSQLDPLAGASFQQNPILPANLPGKTFDAAG